MAAWPATLPPPLLNSLKERAPNNTIRTSMDKGPPKTRRRTTANVRPISFAMRLTDEQVEILDSFFVDDTFSGADEFDFTHPRTGAAVKAIFASPPEYSEMEGVCYNCNVSLEIMP